MNNDTYHGIRWALIRELVDAGELTAKENDYFEDVEGHLIHGAQLDDYIQVYLRSLSAAEHLALIARIGPKDYLEVAAERRDIKTDEAYDAWEKE